MLNLLIVSDEARAIYSPFKSSGYTFHAQDAKQIDTSIEREFEELNKYDIAFLDLGVRDWQQKRLIQRLWPAISQMVL